MHVSATTKLPVSFVCPGMMNPNGESPEVVSLIAQVDEWLQMAQHVPDDLRLKVEGDGLLAYLIDETARRGRPPKMIIEE